MLNRIGFAAIFALIFGHADGQAITSAQVATREKVIIDTDIGSDIDDAFAVALALCSPELDILGISTDSGDTEGRARILDRMLGEAGREDIPVAVGVTSKPVIGKWDGLSQGPYGKKSPFRRVSHPKAVDFIIDQIRRYPGEITLVTIGPVPNIGAIIDQSPETFRQLKRVVMMGGSIQPIRPDYGNAAPIEQVAEYNVQADFHSTQKLLLSGVPLHLMPRDSTLHLTLDEVNRDYIFDQGTPLTNVLKELYQQWHRKWGGVTPVLFDPMTIAYILNPRLCPVQPMHIRIDDEGYTRAEPGVPNAQVCMHSDLDAFIRFYMTRLIGASG